MAPDAFFAILLVTSFMISSGSACVTGSKGAAWDLHSSNSGSRIQTARIAPRPSRPEQTPDLSARVGDFDIIDLNGDGQVTITEWKAMFKLLLASLDSNNDGQISRAELLPPTSLTNPSDVVEPRLATSSEEALPEMETLPQGEQPQQECVCENAGTQLTTTLDEVVPEETTLPQEEQTQTNPKEPKVKPRLPSNRRLSPSNTRRGKGRRPATTTEEQVVADTTQQQGEQSQQPQGRRVAGTGLTTTIEVAVDTTPQQEEEEQPQQPQARLLGTGLIRNLEDLLGVETAVSQKEKSRGKTRQQNTRPRKSSLGSFDRNPKRP